jgi:hypothetical protein
MDRTPEMEKKMKELRGLSDKVARAQQLLTSAVNIVPTGIKTQSLVTSAKAILLELTEELDHLG